MKAAEILGVETVRFIEPEFTAQTDMIFNTMLAAEGGTEGRFLLDEKEDPLCLAFRNERGWVAASFLYRNPSVGLIEKFEDLNGQIFQEDRAEWTAAMREYFSTMLAAATAPAIEDLNPVRRGILTEVISKAWGKGEGRTCTDCCCGSGVGSLVLRDLGYAPLSFDNDASLLSRGLATGRLLPQGTMQLDAMMASRYIEPVPLGIGIMMGEINDFSREMWERIVQELFLISEETLITVGTEPEAHLIRAWGEEMERTVDVSENISDPIYDRWVCIAKQK
jgi:hypothetical protein